VKIHVVWFGRAATSPFEHEVETYRRRVGRRWPCDDLCLRPAAGGRDRDPRRALRREAESIASRRQAGWPMVALDERGHARDSSGFARWLGDLDDRGTPGLDFVIGSDLGLDRALVADADHRLSLGPLTLPHELARLVLWEQLFRASSILGGGAYHRSCVQ
jgi:23S rRNA (pseudouridine1915-N3)-methyltransferase